MKRIKTLVIDDNSFARQIIRRELDKHGCDVTEAFSGESGLAALKDAHQQGKPYQLIVCDMNMPEMDGQEVFRRISANPDIAMTEFVMITAQIDKASVIAAHMLGIRTFIPKPISEDAAKAQLMKVIESLQNAG